MKKILFFVLLLTLFLMLVSCDDAILDRQGLKFYRTDNDSYAVEVGDAKYLSEIVIPNTYLGRPVVEIGTGGFEDCKNLKSITIPKNLKKIGRGAFAGCSLLEEINFNAIEMNDREDIIFSDSSAGAEEVTVNIGADVKRIPSYLFYSSGVTEVNFAEESACERIGDNAFGNCTHLTSFTIPESVTEIGDYAFARCTELASITIPESVTEIGGFAFKDCEALTTVTIPESITAIHEYAFENCTALTSFTIPESVTEIGSYAFSNCKALRNINIPEGVNEIGERAFLDCEALMTVTIPKSVTAIREYAFAYCHNLKEIRYRGSAGMWYAIQKGNSWKYGVEKCTFTYNYDGE